MLATGIDVEARPPGKKVKRLSLLSGGERVADRDRVPGGHLQGPAVAVLRAGRGRGGAGRHQPAAAAGDPGRAARCVPAHRRDAPEADHGGRGHPVRRSACAATACRPSSASGCASARPSRRRALGRCSEAAWRCIRPVCQTGCAMVEDLIIAVVAVVVVGGGTAGLVPYARSRRQCAAARTVSRPRAVSAPLERGDALRGPPRRARSRRRSRPRRQHGPRGRRAARRWPRYPAALSSGRRHRPGGSPGCASRLARSHSAFGSVLLNLISVRQARRAGLGGDRGHAHQRGHGRRPGPRAGRAAARPRSRWPARRTRSRSGSCCGPTWSP